MSLENNNTPYVILYFFRWYCHPDFVEDLEGDLIERYQLRKIDKGNYNAYWNLIRDVLALFRPGIIKSFERSQKLNYYGMLKHDLLIGWRSLLKNKGYAFLNIGGLTIGLTVSILIGLWVHDELSFNKFHQNYDRIARVLRHEVYNGEHETNAVMTTGMGSLIAQEYENRFDGVAMVRQRIEERLLIHNDEKFNSKGYFMQPMAPKMLSLKMVRGTQSGLDDMLSIMLSESLSEKFFGKENPIGKLVEMDGADGLKVTGVYEDLPKNTTYCDASFIAPLDYYLYGWSDLNVWDNYNMHILVQLKAETNLEETSKAIESAILPHLGERTKSRNPSFFLQPMNEWNLYGEFKDGKPIISERMKFVIFYALIGVFILILACINFMNLSTARASKRMKEIGVRKSMGALRGKLTFQFLCESFIVTFLALTAAILLTFLLLPGFNIISSKQLVMPWTNFSFWLTIFVFSLFTAILSGSYPAFYLSSLDPIRSLKGTFKPGRFSAIPRKALVVFQFSISTLLIIGTLIVKQQIDHAKNRPAGYEKDRLISLRASSPDYWGKYDLLRDRLKGTGVVDEIAESNYSVTSHLGWNEGIEWQGKDPNYIPVFNTVRVTPEYAKTIGLEFQAGRDFSRELITDESTVIINESAAKLLKGMKLPLVGQTIDFDNGNFNGSQFKIVGIVKDMVKGSPFANSFPSILFPTKKDQGWLYIKVNANVPLRDALYKIEKTYGEVIPGAPFDFRFADEEYNAKFQEEEKIASLAWVLAGLAIFISSLGLFGLVSYVAEQRTKEIGIRKVLGASVMQLWSMLSGEFVLLVGISCLIAIPISWYFMQEWLSQYDYKIEISAWILILGGASSLILTILTVSFKTLMTSRLNPVESLRDE